ncbi:MAG: hypothetical protein WA459_19540 [Stellaceae bacterium]
MRKIALAAAMIGVLVMPAFAQAPPAGTPTRIRGTVDKLDGQTLTVKSREGPVLTIALAPNFTVAAVVKKRLSDIKAGDYVGAASTRGADGKLRAIEVLIFPAAMRGVAEGERPWDLVGDSVMTNATVTGVASAPGGRALKVSYKGGVSEVVVPPAAPVVTFGPGDAKLLKRGAAVFLIAQKALDGSLTAARVTAEKDGIKPPM